MKTTELKQNKIEKRHTQAQKHKSPDSRGLRGSTTSRLPSKSQIKDYTRMLQHYHEKKHIGLFHRVVLMSYSLMRQGEKPEWTSEHSPRKYHFLPLSEQLKTRLVCAFFPCQLQGPLGDSSPGRERERKRLPWGEELPRASESLFTTSCACYFIKIEHRAFLLPLFSCAFGRRLLL